ncbi:MAG: bifunctional UDP-N-acetylglucosamine diphosphorylase/glucosamine-1-phosphate N-acetyltransferase GlmU [Oscillospiraceae bacterium]|jgi:bifunctional UDP-N-acetylglucosamine pyrophosphorylase/glucosamine-1-phosphate N-acetyltransferase|nr:bifunctional UDP-N-acetylglucosamine diphosphorylase/glucosamine-1-phosphate N-acetyltransferase GlmU [Oscillospiraceae bacterium]
MVGSCAVILAAGEGKRMKSDRPKVMLNVLFKPMLRWVIDSVLASGTKDICAIVGFKEEVIKSYLGNEFETVSQYERRGTGHAVMQAKDFMGKFSGGDVLVLCGDAPFMDADTIRTAYEKHISEGNAATIISAELAEPKGYGRIIRDNGIGPVLGIVEHKDASEKQRRIKEINSGAYWFKIDKLLPILDTEHLHNDNAQNEYYLPEVITIFLKKGYKVNAYKTSNTEAVMGANDCLQLNSLSSIARKKILDNLLVSGVEMPCSEGIIIGPDVRIGTNVTILPGTILKGKTKIGSSCTVGPNSLVDSCTIGDNTVVNASQCYNSKIGSRVEIGPFAHIRPECDIGEEVRIGDYVELKKSKVGSGTKISHLTYIGDTSVGTDVNIGCGCVTANYDGKSKYKCTIGNGAFIGCNTNLVAPVKVGENAVTAAGTTVTADVPDNALAIGRKRQELKLGWSKPSKR